MDPVSFSIFKILCKYDLQFTVRAGGGSVALLDILSADKEIIKDGLEELKSLADYITADLEKNGWIKKR